MDPLYQIAVQAPCEPATTNCWPDWAVLPQSLIRSVPAPVSWIA
nr:hypothetical protein [Streptomyces kunmingensis]